MNETVTTTSQEVPTTKQNLAHVEGQTLYLPSSVNPQESTFFMYPAPGIDQPYTVPGGVESAMMEPGHWGRWWNSAYWGAGTDEQYLRLFEKFEIVSETKIEGKVIENAYWSDGVQITALDAVAPVYSWTVPQPDRPVETTNQNGVTDEIRLPDGRDGLTFELRSPRKGYSRWAPENLWFWIGTFRGTFTFPTHIEPYKTILEKRIELWDRTWESLDDVPQVTKNTVDKSVFEEFRDPKKVVTSGAWTLSEVRGTQEYVLKPNEHWRHADQVNFDEVIFEYIPSDSRYQAALQADRLDFGSMQLSPGSAKSLPDSIEQRLAPVSEGNGIGVDHSHPALGKRKVRAAIAYTLNKPQIASNVHPKATKPIDIPAGDTWARELIASDKWVTENLIGYSQNTKKANQLMRDAGLSKRDGTWIDPNGNEMKVQLPTTSDAPTFETTVADQLSEFGIETQVQTYDDATYTNKWENGDFDIWPETMGTGFYKGISTLWWWGISNYSRLTTRNWFDPEAQKKVEDAYSKTGWIAGNWKAWKPLIIRIPPIGQPDGPLQTFRPSYVYGEGARGAETVEAHKKAFWIFNWWLPSVPVYQAYSQNWLDTTHWIWPTDHPMWEYFDVSFQPADLLSMNLIHANPEHPVEGATVEQ